MRAEPTWTAHARHARARAPRLRPPRPAQFYYIEHASLVRHNLTMLQGSARVGKVDP